MESSEIVEDELLEKIAKILGVMILRLIMVQSAMVIVIALLILLIN